MTQTAPRTDLELQQAVMDELRWTPSINSSLVRVTVHGDTATLTGEVPTYPETLAAAKAALRVRGVGAVAQELAVHSRWAAATDGEIASHAADALARAINVPDSVKATVHQHDITLSGEVTWQYEREAACRAIAFIPGVEMVVNEIGLRAGTPSIDIRSDIMAALRRNAEIEGALIEVVTDSRGVITLEGTVRSAAQARHAEKVCWSAPGVTAVHNHLAVE